MLLPGSELIGTSIMGLQTGKELATASAAVVNPHNLSIIAYRIAGPHLDYDPSYLRTADIRELGSLGIIIDSSDEFIEPEDIITDKAIYEIEFELIGKHVIDDHKKKVGKVADYVVDVDSFVIQQLIVKRPLLKSFGDDELLVHRGQIIEVNDHTIIIKSGKVKETVVTKASRQYVNPFRATAPQPESMNSDNRS